MTASCGWDGEVLPQCKLEYIRLTLYLQSKFCKNSNETTTKKQRDVRCLMGISTFQNPPEKIHMSEKL